MSGPLPFLLPALIVAGTFQVAPVLISAWNSMFSFSMLDPTHMRFVGWENYARAAADPRFQTSIRNSVLYALGSIALEVPIGLALALLVNRQTRAALGLRLIIFAPVVSSTAVISIIWLLMYHPQNGLIDGILGALGLPRQPFITSASQALPSVLTVSVWQDVGFVMLIFLAGLQSIATELYEAASIDGAGRGAQFLNVTLPLIRRTMLYAVVLTTVSSFRIFTPIYVLTGGGPQDSSTSAAFYVYKTAFTSLAMGYASALAVILVAVIALIAVAQALLLRSNAS